MIFSSNIFLFLFLPVSLLGYQLLHRLGQRAILAWLSLVSLFFYGFWSPAYLLLLGACILFNYAAGRLIAANTENEPRQSAWLVAAITGNLLLLMYFKYLFPLLNFFHTHGVLPHAFTNVILPLGISFFTFTQIAYLIDLKQGIAVPQTLLSFTLFVTFFPHLIAGPIIHPREMMPQFAADRIGGGLRRDDLAIGLTWFLLGLGKKVLVADRLAPLANSIFGHPAGFGWAATWIGVLAYSMQLYFDFSGYSDMALGIARMFSIEFPINFNSPYKSASIVEYWTRWHMTLSRYLNEYLYTPISHAIRVRRTNAGKKSTRKAVATAEGFWDLVALPTLTTMIIAGIWHGAGIQYILYGILHGVFISAYHLWKTFVPKESPLQKLLPHPVSVLLTYACVLLASIFFRAGGVRDAFYLTGTLVGLHGRGAPLLHNAYLLPGRSQWLNAPGPATAALALCFAIVWFLPNTQQLMNQLPRQDESERLAGWWRRLVWRPSVGWGFGVAMMTALSILLLNGGSTFLYFQF